MDLRKKKTLQLLRNAFLQLRAKKPLEKITVKELAELAEISKATFYLHYRDIYDISDQLQQETILDVYNCIKHPEKILTDTAEFTRELTFAFYSHQHLTTILFEGSQASVLPTRLEQLLLQQLYERFPQLKMDTSFHILLTYQVHGGYHAYKQHFNKCSIDDIIDSITRASNAVSQEMKGPYTS